MKDKKYDGLKILVVEDTPIHQESARKLITGCTLDIITNYYDATNLIRDITVDGGKQYDVVLTDLFIPFAEQDHYPLEGKFKEATTPNALGYPLAMFAYANGIDAGILTMADHHDGAMAASVDEFSFFISGDDAYMGNCPIIKGTPSLWFFSAGFYGLYVDHKDISKKWDQALDVILGYRKPELW